MMLGTKKYEEPQNEMIKKYVVTQERSGVIGIYEDEETAKDTANKCAANAERAYMDFTVYLVPVYSTAEDMYASAPLYTVSKNTLALQDPLED